MHSTFIFEVWVDGTRGHADRKRISWHHPSFKGEVGFASRREARFVAISNEQISLYIRFLCSISTDLKPFITINQNILNAHSERSERQEEYILHIDYTDTYIHYTHYISIYIYFYIEYFYLKDITTVKYQHDTVFKLKFAVDIYHRYRKLHSGSTKEHNIFYLLITSGRSRTVLKRGFT